MDCGKIRQRPKSRDIIYCSVLQHRTSCIFAQQIFPMHISKGKNWTESYSSNRLSQEYPIQIIRTVRRVFWHAYLFMGRRTQVESFGE
eukprot:7607865-Karenia_brevis.AAC.1